MSFPFPVARLYRKHYAGGGEIGDDGTEMDIDPGVEPGRISNNIPIRSIDGSIIYPGDAGNPIVRLPVPAVGRGRINPVGAPPVEDVPAGISRPVSDEPLPEPSPRSMPIRSRIGLRAPVDFGEASDQPEAAGASAIRSALEVAGRKKLIVPDRGLVIPRAGELAARPAGAMEMNDRAHPAWIPQAMRTRTTKDERGKTINVPLGQLDAGSASPVTDRSLADIARLKLTPEMYGQYASLIRQYRNTREAMGTAGSDNVIGAFKDHIKENLLDLYHRFNALDPELVPRSMLWYVGGNKLVNLRAEQTGLPDYATAGAYAALSPQKDWFQNVSLGDRVIHTVTNEADHRWTPAMDDTFNRIRGNALTPGTSYDAPNVVSAFNFVRGKSLNDIRELLDRANIPPEAKDVAKGLWVRLFDEAHHEREHRVVTPEGHFGDIVYSNQKDERGRPMIDPAAWGSLSEIGKSVGAVEAGQAGDPRRLHELMGMRHKVRNFYNNLLDPNGPRGDITMDTHAIAAALMRPFSSNSPEVMHNFGSSLNPKSQAEWRLQYPDSVPPNASTKGSTGIRGLYPIYADAYREAAKELGILPRELQSVTWEAVRGLFTDKWKSPATRAQVNAIWDEYRSGKISAAQARERTHETAGGIDIPSWHGKAGTDPRNLPLVTRKRGQ